MGLSFVSKLRLNESELRHGCFFAKVGGYVWLYGISMFLALGFVGFGPARADLRLYIEDSDGNSLEIFDNVLIDTGSELLGDTDGSINYITVSEDSLTQAFGVGWSFGPITASNTFTVTNFDEAVRRLNVQFDATNLTVSSEKWIEVKVLGTASWAGPTELMLYGAGTTKQGLTGNPNPPPFEVKVAGAFNQADSGGYTTNDYNDLTGPPLWVLGAKDERIDFTQIGENGVRTFAVDEPNKSSIVGDGFYSATLSFRADGIKYNEQFGIQADLEYFVPEPASIATWGFVTVGMALSARRRRSDRNVLARID